MALSLAVAIGLGARGPGLQRNGDLRSCPSPKPRAQKASFLRVLLPRHSSILLIKGITRQRRVCLLPFVLAFSAPAASFELQHAEAQYIEHEYRFEMTAVLEAPVADVERILRDYTSYPTLDSRILDARVLEYLEPNIAMLATTLRACFGPICRTVKRVERVEESPHALLAVTDVERSDMRFGETRVELASEAQKTKVTYRTRLRPDFWIPALVARRMMLETLENATIELFQNLEKRAQSDANGR